MTEPNPRHAFPELLKKWAREAASRLQPRTITEYRKMLALALALPAFDTLEPPRAAIRGYVYGPGPTGHVPSSSTVRARLAALKSWYRWLAQQELVASDPVRGLDRPRMPGRVTPTLRTPEQVRALLAAAEPTPQGIRYAAAVHVAILTGLRFAELKALSRNALSTGAPSGTIYYTVRVKGGKRRRRELPAAAFASICRALEAQGSSIHTYPTALPFFPASDTAFREALRTLCRRAGLPLLTVHGLRHTAALLRRGAGASIEEVSWFLGHTNIAITATYLRQHEGESDPAAARIAALLVGPPEKRS